MMIVILGITIIGLVLILQLFSNQNNVPNSTPNELSITNKNRRTNLDYSNDATSFTNTPKNFCVACGEFLESSSTFCSYCGTKVN